MVPPITHPGQLPTHLPNTRHYPWCTNTCVSMGRQVTVAATQFACTWDLEANLVRLGGFEPGGGEAAAGLLGCWLAAAAALGEVCWGKPAEGRALWTGRQAKAPSTCVQRCGLPAVAGGLQGT